MPSYSQQSALRDRLAAAKARLDARRAADVLETAGAEATAEAAAAEAANAVRRGSGCENAIWG